MNHIPDDPDYGPRPSRRHRRIFRRCYSEEELAWWAALDDVSAGLAARHSEDVRYFARAVAFEMYVCSNPGFADEFLAVMVREEPDHKRLLLDVVREARRMHAEWMREGRITEYIVADEIYGKAPDA